MKKRILTLSLTIMAMMALLTVSVGAVDVGNAEALTAAITNGAEIKLTASFSANVVIPADTTVTIDLNGQTLTNSGSSHTITNNGTLTITGTGTVDNVTHGKAAVFNDHNGTATLNGGTYTRSSENGSTNTYYTIENYGEMEINSGVSVTNTAGYSSMIHNGYYYASTYVGGNDKPELTIKGGTFSGGINTVKNDEYGNLTITGGSFSNTTQHVIMNWNIASIEGGTFTTTSSWAVYNAYSEASSIGQLTLSGGTYEAGIVNASAASTITFAGDVNITTGYLYNYNAAGVMTINDDVTVTIGTNATLNNKGTILLGSAAAAASQASFTTLEDGSMVANAIAYAVPAAIVIEGEYTNTGDIVVDGTLTVADGADFTNEGTITVEDGATATVAAGATVENTGDITVTGEFTVASTASVTNNGTLDLSSATSVTIDAAIENNDTIILPSTTDAADEETFANITGTGVVEIGEATYDNSGNTAIVEGDFTISGEGLTAGTDYSYTGNTLTILSDKEMTITGTTSTGVISIQAATSNLTLKDLTITTTGTAIAIPATNDGDVTITGEGTITLTSTRGIYDYSDDTLTISGGTWGIDTKSGNYNGITSNGTVVLENATVEVTSKYYAVSTNALDLDGTASLDATATNASGAAVDIVNDGDLTVSEDAALTANSDVQVSGTVTNSGTITVGEDVTLDFGGAITNNGTIVVNDEAALTAALAAGGDVELATDVDLTAALEIPADTTLTIADGVTLDTADNALTVESETATITNEGTIILPDDATSDTIDALNITGEGTVTIDGTSYENDGTEIVVSSGSSAPSSYSSSVPTAANGDVSISSSKATMGTKITITATPDDGYVVGEVTVTYASGREVTVTANDDGTYSYIQPGAAVTVNVTFVDPDAVVEEVDASGFTDVDADAYYYDAMLWAVEKGITTGYADDTFRPTTACTRGQVVTFLWRAAGSPVVAADTASAALTDADSDAYYYQAMVWAVENGITTGYADGTFRANETCTRGQIVTFLFRMDGQDTTDNAAPMTDMVDGAYYYDAALWAIDQGITTGYADGTFQSATLCNRGQIVTFLYRYLG